MRIPFTAIAALAIAGCAAGEGARGGLLQSSVYCDPCPLPCVHDPGCTAGAAAPARGPRVAVTKERLALKETIYFDTAQTTIKPESHSLLDEVAAVLKAHPEVKRVVIEGHTDDRGAAEFNDQLSQGRADAVRSYLVGKGVDGGRLEAKGFGSRRPIADNATAEGREANRRVDFVIAP